MTLKEYIKKLEKERDEALHTYKNIAHITSGYSERLVGKINTLNEIIKDLKELEV